MTAEEMLALQHATSRPRFTDYLSLILGGAGMVGNALQSSRAARLQDQEIALREDETQYAREERARQARMAAALGVRTEDLDRAQIALGAQPLGAEQGFVQRQALFGNALPQVQQIGQGVAGGPVTNPFVGMSGDVYGPRATAQSLVGRRSAIAAVNPDVNFGSLSEFGLGDAGTEGDAAVASAVAQAQARRKAQQDTINALLTQQEEAARSMATPTTGTVVAQPKKKKGGFWSKLGKIASVALPIAFAPFTGGATLAAIGAGAGALGGVASGGGLKGALLGAGMGAIPVPGAAGAKQAVGETAKAAVKRAILNPAAIARIAGAGIGGPVEAVANLAAPFLPGVRPGVSPSVERMPSLPGVSPVSTSNPALESAANLLRSPYARQAPGLSAMNAPLNSPLFASMPAVPTAPPARMRNVVAPKPAALTLTPALAAQLRQDLQLNRVEPQYIPRLRALLADYVRQGDR